MVRPTAIGAGRQHDGAQLLPHRVLVVLERPRVAAPEHAAQDRVAVVPDVLGRLEHLARRHVQEQQHVRHQRQAGLEDLRHDLGRAGRPAAPRGASRPRCAPAPARRRAARRTARTIRSAVSAPSNDTTTTLACSSPSARSTSGSRRVAVHHGIARLARIAHAERVEVERDVLEAALLEHARQVLPDAAEAADDHVLAPREFAGRGRLERHLGGVDRAPAQQEVGDAPL